nr:hypothetical protein [Aedes japonicus narnavirus 1]
MGLRAITVRVYGGPSTALSTPAGKAAYCCHIAKSETAPSGNHWNSCEIIKDSYSRPFPSLQLTPPGWVAHNISRNCQILLRVRYRMTVRIEHYRPCCFSFGEGHQHCLRRFSCREPIKETALPHASYVRYKSLGELGLDGQLSDNLQTFCNVSERRIFPHFHTRACEGYVFPRRDLGRFTDRSVFERLNDALAAGILPVPCTGYLECRLSALMLTSTAALPHDSCQGVGLQNRRSIHACIRSHQSRPSQIHSSCVSWRNPWIGIQSHLLAGCIRVGGQGQPRTLLSQGSCGFHCCRESTRVGETSPAEYSRVKQWNSTLTEVGNDFPVHRQETLADGLVHRSSLELGKARCSRRRDRNVIWNRHPTLNRWPAAKKGADGKVSTHMNTDRHLRLFEGAPHIGKSTWGKYVELGEEWSRAHRADFHETSPKNRSLIERSPSYFKGSLCQYELVHTAEALETIGLSSREGDKVFIPIGLILWDGSDQVVTSSYRRGHADHCGIPLRGTRKVGHGQVVQVQYRPRYWQPHHTASFAHNGVHLSGCVFPMSGHQSAKVRVVYRDRTEKVPTQGTQRSGSIRPQSVADSFPKRLAHVKWHEVSRSGKVCAVELRGPSTNEAVGQIIVEGIESLGSRPHARQVDPPVLLKKGPDGPPARVSGYDCPGRRLRYHSRLHPQFTDDRRGHRDGCAGGSVVECGHEGSLHNHAQVFHLIPRRHEGLRVFTAFVVPGGGDPRPQRGVPLETLFFVQCVRNRLEGCSYERQGAQFAQLASLRGADRFRGRTREARCRVHYWSGPVPNSRLCPLRCPGAKSRDQLRVRIHRVGQNFPMLPQTNDPHLLRASRHCSAQPSKLSQSEPALSGAFDGSFNEATFKRADREASRRLGTRVLKASSTAEVGVLLDLLCCPFDTRASHGDSDPLVERIDRLYRGRCTVRQSPLLTAGQQRPDSQTEGVPDVLCLPPKEGSSGVRCSLRACTLRSFRRNDRIWRLRVEVGPSGQPLRVGVAKDALAGSSGLLGCGNGGGQRLYTSTLETHD